MAEVRLTNINKTFGTVETIPDLTLLVPDGSFTVLVVRLAAESRRSFAWSLVWSSQPEA